VISLSQQLKSARGMNMESDLYFKQNRCALALLLKQAGKSVPYYRRLLGHYNVEDDILKDYYSFSQIPLTSKEEYRLNTREFISDEARDHGQELNRYFTSGSTGVPLTIYKSKRDTLRTLLRLFKARNATCRNISRKRRIQFFAVNQEYAANIKGRRPNDYYLDNRIDSVFVNASRISVNALQSYWDIIAKYKPAWISSNPVLLTEMARFALRRRLNSGTDNLEYIECHSEFLTDAQADLIEKAFRIPPLSLYGANEANAIALQCRFGKMHIITEISFVEILDSSGRPVPEGSVGGVYVTTLQHFDTPLIRYGLGDQAALQFLEAGCSCGNSAPYLLLTGYRESDYLVKENGTLIDGWCISGIFENLKYLDMPAIAQYQLIQVGYIKFILKVLMSACATDRKAFEIEFEKQLALVMGTEVSVAFEYPASLDRDSKTGKYKCFICRVASSGQGR
jgi:phenylacetate-CoA ligase